MKQNNFATSPAKRCSIAEDCNRYPFLTIASFRGREPVHFKPAAAFLVKRIKFLANQKRATVINDTFLIIFDFQQLVRYRQLPLTHQQHRHKPRQSIPQLA